MMGRSALSICFGAGFGAFAHLASGATIQLPTTPDWENTDAGRYGTGLGIADLNGDGWLDFVVANGNDMGRQHVTAWLNRGDGTYNADPDWISQDIDFHCHLDLADVDGDGSLDLAVAVFYGHGGYGTPGHVKLYKGGSGGIFSPNPVWQSAETFYCFSVAFGDMDMDGRPDLACATGDPYYDHPERRRVYHNLGGVLETTPSWTSTEVEYSNDVTWADFDKDGFLDLAFAGSSNPNRIYFSRGGLLQRTAGWSSTDAARYANTAAAGDVDGDGFIDLAIADNSPAAGYGKFKLYRNLGTGSLTTTPVWQSIEDGSGSNVSLVDIDEDGDLDLSTGVWWGPVRIYENVGGTLGAAPAYTSATNSVIENEVWEDIDNDGLQRGLTASWQGNGASRLFYFPVRPVRSILWLTIDDVPVDPASVYLDRDDAWMVLPSTPAAGARIFVAYISSADLDLLLSNWDDTEGEYLFLNRRNPTDVAGSTAPAPIRLLVGPNPTDGQVRISLWNDGGMRMNDVIEVFDVAGRRLRTWPGASAPIVWDGSDAAGHQVSGGAYFIRWSRTSAHVAPLVTRVIRR